MKKINPLELFLWTFRRNENDVINLYDSLSDLMRTATEGDMLNFGYWEDSTVSPLDAQKNLCRIFGEKAQLESNLKIVDVGSGFGSPALQWHSDYNPLEVTCININYDQLRHSLNKITKPIDSQENFNFFNATATMLPFENETIDRVMALESAQHFKPLKNFCSESFRILKKNGILAIAIPVMVETHTAPLMKLGTLSMTWSSEHYSIDFIENLLKKEGFENIGIQKIGSNVYEPLSNYYLKNRESLKSKILNHYPSYVEKILFNSLNKMKEVSKKKIIDYILVMCEK